MKNAIINMVRAFGLTLLLVWLLLVWGCKTSKHVEFSKVTSEVRTEKTDSVAKTDTQHVTRQDMHRHIRVEKDSVGAIPGEEVLMALEDVELKPVTDAAGDLQGRTFTASKGHVHAAVTVNKDGGIRISCREDSLRLVVFRYRADSISMVHSLDSIRSSSWLSSYVSAHDSIGISNKDVMIVRDKKNGWIVRVWQSVKNIFALVGLLWLVFFLIGYFRKVT